MPLRALLSAAVVVLTLSWPNVAEAQRNCSKGKPCGNSCISRDKVCRIGASSSTPAPAADPSPRAAATAQTLTSPPATDDDPTPAETAPDYPWVGSFADGIYFKATCPAAQDLAPSNRRYFRAVQDAEGAGFRRSRTPGC